VRAARLLRGDATKGSVPQTSLINQLDGYTGLVSHSSSDGAAGRELVFMCADTGAVIDLSYTAGSRPALARALVFLASGETLWADGGPESGSRATLTVRERGAAGQYDLRLSVQGALLPGAADLTADGPVAGRRVPVGLELTVEPASARLTLGAAAAPEGQVTLLRGTGSLAVGSVIRRLELAGWSATGKDGGPGAAAGVRARAVFQDGSALYAVGETADRSVAALVRNTQIGVAAIGAVTVRGEERGRPGRTVSWTGDDRSPASASGRIRDPRQRVAVTSADPSGAGLQSWSCAPFVFVRSGVTGLGLVERRAALATPAPVAEADGELPDPF
jgi:hypothetical protein